MKKTILALAAACAFAVGLSAHADALPDYKKYAPIIRENIGKDFKGMYRESGGGMPHPFLTPGSTYADHLWDWDSWWSNVALRQILADIGTEEDRQQALKYEKGSILNFLEYTTPDGWMPIMLTRDSTFEKLRPKDLFTENMHKPCIAQHAAFIVKNSGGDAEWLRGEFSKIQFYLNGYKTRQFHRPTGLYFWINDVMVGVDNDPSTWYRPERSSASIYLNFMMYKELLATAYLAEKLDLGEIAQEYAKEAQDLKNAIRENCWDEWTGFYYSVDINLLPRIDDRMAYHLGAQRNYEGLIQRFGVWTGFMSMWSGIATPEQAKRIVNEHFKNEKTFNAPCGVRTLSKLEKMYTVKAGNNPSSWLGPVWGISNYIVWKGLVDYGFEEEAKELAAKTVVMFGRDFERSGALHEYYQPENGEPILNKGFMNWNYLVLNMLDWLEGKEAVSEF